jgi:glutamine amidotransferase
MIQGYVKKFPEGVLSPQVGFNKVSPTKNSYLFAQGEDLNCYFVHSYYCDPVDRNLTLAETEYDINFCSAVQKDNFYGFKFHPEKSAEKGEKIILNFLEKC